MAGLDKKSLIDIAVTQYKDGFYEEVIISCKNILILDKFCIAAYYGLTKSLIRLGRYDEALDTYSKALLTNETKELHKRKGDLHFTLKEYRQAYNEYLAAKDLNYDEEEIMPKILTSLRISNELENQMPAKTFWQNDFLEDVMDEMEDDEYRKEMQEEYNEQLGIADDEYWGAYYMHNGFTKYYDEYS